MYNYWSGGWYNYANVLRIALHISEREIISYSFLLFWLRDKYKQLPSFFTLNFCALHSSQNINKYYVISHDWFNAAANSLQNKNKQD